METEGTLPFSQEPTPGPYPESDEYSQHLPTYFVTIRYNMNLRSTPNSSQHLFRLNVCFETGCGSTGQSSKSESYCSRLFEHSVYVTVHVCTVCNKKISSDLNDNIALYGSFVFSERALYHNICLLNFFYNLYTYSELFKHTGD
jgi:hypothetical protein